MGGRATGERIWAFGHPLQPHWRSARVAISDKGRPAKYATDEERKETKREKTILSTRKKREKEKTENIIFVIE